MAAGCTLVVLGLILLGLSDNKFYPLFRFSHSSNQDILACYQITLTYSVLGGLGSALLNTPVHGAIAHFFHARRGLATGVASTAGGIGRTLIPLLLRHLLGRLAYGYRATAQGQF